MLEQEREILYRIASNDRIRLDSDELPILQALVTQGLLQKIEAPKQEGLKTQYQSLQEKHGLYQEAKTLLERIQKRLEPKTRLGGLLSSGQVRLLPEFDPDLVNLHTLLETLDIKIRNLEEARDIPEQIGKLKEHLAVDSRHCLDRLGAIDREIDTIQKSAPVGIQIDPAGCFVLTKTGTEALPEFPVLEELDGLFSTVSGPRKHKLEEFAHFQKDPANILAFFMECLGQGELASEVLLEFESLLEAFERLSLFSEIRSVRLKNAFLIRLMRTFTDDPKLCYLWCSRERFPEVMGQVRSLLSKSSEDPGWQLLHATDLLLARSGSGDPLEQEAVRIKAYSTIQQRLREALSGMGLSVESIVRLELAMLHSALAQNFAGSTLLERFVTQMTEASLEGSRLAPKDLPDPGSRLLFGFHLAHMSGFISSRMAPLTELVTAIDAALLEEGSQRRVPVQVILHTLLSLKRLERLGVSVSPREYAGTLIRIRKKLYQHKGIARALRMEFVTAEDEAFLAANLTARCYFPAPSSGMEAKKLLDVGLAGAYEPSDPFCPPVLGLPFGTLMLT